MFIIIASCSQSKKSETTNISEQDSHINFLSIGNAHYERDASGAVDNFMDVQGANKSAEGFYDLFSCYGSGLKLTSSKNKLLTKELIHQYVDSIVNIAIKDSLSTTFIYYCGHGFSDSAGNIFMVPGDHNFNEKKVSSLTSLVAVNDLQKKIREALHKQYPKHGLKERELVQTFKNFEDYVHTPKNSMKEASGQSNRILEDMYNKLKKISGKIHRPRFVILADCCTENFKVLNRYLFVDKKNSMVDMYDSVMKQYKGGEKGYARQVAATRSKMLNLSYTLSVGMLKFETVIAGNRTVYTGNIGQPAKMAISPLDNKTKVGPICRRLQLFFANDRTSFSVSKLLTTLCNKSFDKLSETPKFEMVNNNWFGDGEDIFETTNYKPKVTEYAYFDKKDSIVYTCNRK